MTSLEAAQSGLTPVQKTQGGRAATWVEELRGEARHLLAAAHSLSDFEKKKEIAARAVALAMRAEAIENSMENPAIIPVNIRRYQSRMRAGISDETYRKTVEEMLTDAETLLGILRKKPS